MAPTNTLSMRDVDAAVHQLLKRKSWPAKNVGVMVVFCIVFVGMLPSLPKPSPWQPTN